MPIDFLEGVNAWTGFSFFQRVGVEAWPVVCGRKRVSRNGPYGVTAIEAPACLSPSPCSLAIESTFSFCPPLTCPPPGSCYPALHPVSLVLVTVGCSVLELGHCFSVFLAVPLVHGSMLRTVLLLKPSWH